MNYKNLKDKYTYENSYTRFFMKDTSVISERRLFYNREDGLYQ